MFNQIRAGNGKSKSPPIPPPCGGLTEGLCSCESRSESEVASPSINPPVQHHEQRNAVTDDEIRKWNDLRLELFAGARIPPHTLAAILHDARRLDFDRAMRALPIYRAQKPYRGFYAVDWARAYDMTAPVAAGGTGRAASRAPAPCDDERSEMERVESDKRREIDDYMRVPPDRRREARTKLESLGWPMNDDSRAWRMIVTKWHRGEDVSSIHHPSKLCRSLPEQKTARVSRDELRRELEALIKGAQWRIAELDAGGGA